MADSIKFQIEGLDQIKKMLSDLPNKINEKVRSDLHRAGAKIVADELKRSAPDGDNNKKNKNKIANNIILKRGYGSSWLVGFSKRAFAVRFVEKGTKVRTTKGNGKYKTPANRGSINRKPFVKQSHQRAYPRAVQYMVSNYAKIVSQSVKRQLNRLKKAK